MGSRYVIYYRVSAARKGRSGLDLEAQKATVMAYLNGGGHSIIGEYTEIESYGKSDRLELSKAIRDCRLKNARLIVAKLDRLSRNIGFIDALQKSAVKFTVAEMPDASELTIHIYAAMAQNERKLINQRTKDALASLKAEGKLGSPIIKRGERIPGSGGPVNAAKATAAKKSKADSFAKEIAQVVKEKGWCKQTLCDIADALNHAGFKTRRGKEWRPVSVKRILDRG